MLKEIATPNAAARMERIMSLWMQPIVQWIANFTIHHRPLPIMARNQIAAAAIFRGSSSQSSERHTIKLRTSGVE
jgi:hypothetical protein